MRFPYEIKDFNEIQKGDRIEVTYADETGTVLIGNVRHIGMGSASGSHYVDCPRFTTFSEAFNAGNTSIRILSRPKPEFKEGDIIRRDELHNLPPYSIISDTHREGRGPFYYWSKTVMPFEGSLTYKRWVNMSTGIECPEFETEQLANWAKFTIEKIGLFNV